MQGGNQPPQVSAAGPDSGTGGADPSSRRLQAKVKQYEGILKKTEAERTELKSKLTLAEGKAAAMEKLLAEKARAYAKSSQEMRQELQKNGIDVSRFRNIT